MLYECNGAQWLGHWRRRGRDRPTPGPALCWGRRACQRQTLLQPLRPAVQLALRLRMKVTATFLGASSMVSVSCSDATATARSARRPQRRACPDCARLAGRVLLLLRCGRRLCNIPLTGHGTAARAPAVSIVTIQAGQNGRCDSRGKGPPHSAMGQTLSQSTGGTQGAGRTDDTPRWRPRVQRDR